MKLKYASLAVVSALMLQACAGVPSLKDTKDTLTVYPDNRVGYVLSTDGRSSARVWSSDNQILALRFQNQLINAKDMAWVDVEYTGKSRMPITVVVSLKSGERLAAEIADWGSELYVKGKVEWVACTKEKACEYLEHWKGIPRFPGFPDLLTIVTEGAIYNEAQRLATSNQPDASAKDLATHNVADALPLGSSRYRMEFLDIKIVSDVQGQLQKLRKRNEEVSKCTKEKVRRQDLERRAHEEKVLRSNPTPQDLRLLEAWKRSLSTGFSQTLLANGECERAVPK